MIISISGIDGAGKTTLINKIVNYFHLIGHTVEIRKFSSEYVKTTLENKFSDEFLKTGMYHFGMATAICQEFFGKETQYETDVVIYDRYKWCRLAVAEMYGCCPSEMNILKKMYSSFPLVDINFHLLVDENLAIERIQKRGEDKENLEELKNFSFKYKKYLPKKNLFFIDANGTEENTFEQVYNIIEGRKI